MIAGAELDDAVAADASVVDARRLFDTCMNGADVLALMTLFEEAHTELVDRELGATDGLEGALSEARSLERQIGTARAACKEDSGLVAVEASVAERYFEEIAGRWFAAEAG